MISHRLLSRTCRRALQTVAGKSRPLSPVINQSGIVNASHDIDPSEFAPKQAVLLRKITRYEYEKQISQITSEEELKTYVSLLFLSLPLGNSLPEVLLSSYGQCPQLVSDHLRLWRVYSGGICQQVYPKGTHW